MPVVDNSENSKPQRKRNVTFSTFPALDIEVHRPGGDADSMLSLTRRSSTFPMDQTMYTVSEFNATVADTVRSLNLTPRDDVGRSLVTNGLDEVSERDVDSFVDDVLHIGLLDSLVTVEERVDNGYGLGSRCLSPSGGLGGPVWLSKEQLQYLERAPDTAERLARLAELEEMSRQEIFAAWLMNSTLLKMGAARVIPTIRRCRAANEKASKNRDVIVIHAKDINVRANDDPGLERNWNSPRFEALGHTGSFSPPDESGVDEPSPEVTEHYQILALTGRAVNVKNKVRSHIVSDTWDFLSRCEASEVLNKGDVFFRFVCSPITNLSEDSLKIIDTLINLSSFRDELGENNVPRVDVYSNEEQRKYVSILVKTMNLLPGVSISSITPELVASLDYQRSCQPGENKFEPSDDPHTFRQVKTLIRFIYSITIQMKVSEITDSNVLLNLKEIDGMVPAKALMLERTKKNIMSSDSTVKVRSFLLYYPVNEGVLVNNQTIVINKSLPRVASKLLQTFGSQGASDAVKTAVQTRNYFFNRFGDGRTGGI